MATLENMQGGSLVSDPSSALNLFLQTFGTAQSREREEIERRKQQTLLELEVRKQELAEEALRQKQQEQEEDKGPKPGEQEQVDILSGADATTEQKEAALVRLGSINPTVANSVRATLESGDKAEIASLQREAEKGFKQATLIQNQKTLAGKRAAIASLARETAATGGDPMRALNLLDLPEDQLNLEVQKMLTMGTDIKSLTDPFTLGPGQARFTAGAEEIASQPVIPTDIAKLNADLEAGRITPAQHTKAVDKALREKAPLVKIAGETEASKLAARSDAVVRDEVRGNARIASRQLGKVRSLSKLLEATGTGALTQFAPQIGRLIPGFDATNEQAAQAQVNQFALDLIGDFKGPTSDRELAFVNQTIQNLGNTPEANRIITRSLENVIFLAGQENNQFDEFVKGKGKPRDFIFDFQKVLFPNHPTFGNITLDDIQTTAFDNQITMERALQELRKR